MTLLLDSCFSSSQAIQKSMFSSLNSVRRNSRKAFLPAGVSINLSNDWAQAFTSSRVGAGLREEGKDKKREMNDCYSSCLQLAGGIWHHHGTKSTRFIGLLIPHQNYPSANSSKHIYKMLFESVLIKSSRADDWLHFDAEIAVYCSE